MNIADHKLASSLVAKVISDGHLISVFDGEDWCLNYSKDESEIFEALDSTGEDTIKVSVINSTQDSDNVWPPYTDIGSFYLIWDNGSDEEPMIAISDYNDNEYCNSVVQHLEKIFPEDWHPSRWFNDPVEASPGRKLVDSFLPNERYFGSPSNSGKAIKDYWASMPTIDPGSLSNQDLSSFLRDLAMVADSEPDHKLSAVGLADILCAVADRLDPEEV